MSTKGTDWDLIEPQLTYGWLLALAYEHGWQASWNQIKAVAVMTAESQRFARAWHINRDPETGEAKSLDQGLWQINDKAHPYDGNIWNPWENFSVARKIFTGRQHQFNAWAAYNSGAYLKYVPAVSEQWVIGRWRNKLPRVTNWDLMEFSAPTIPTP